MYSTQKSGGVYLSPITGYLMVYKYFQQFHRQVWVWVHKNIIHSLTFPSKIAEH